ncbi:TPMT family class I SAM-dependent methyltransferase [Solitalea sp. MAHUQ-68]|uniref:TPMT family class I SAM-dependent methyltransferase n=1 Tax=Solitalea agri TaxID=2953739 RepID=A0A9X2F229_9SPHI|nr:methyltransferase [Solitalea agri]MCO4292685.1 TPMT family class I SAM-dependent methyltransferase [Solitalea agri]
MKKEVSITDLSLDADFWNNRYQTAQTGWDLGTVSPPLKAYIDQLTNKSISILIPGCGNAYEAEYLLEQGFSAITLVDISETITKQIKEKLSNWLDNGLTIITGDFFELSGSYDLILEQTFFCALDPLLREKYVKKVHDLLNPNGKLVGVLFNRNFEQQGPPFGGTKEEYKTLFEANFELKTINECYNSVKPRAGSELFINLSPKSSLGDF